MSAAAPAEDLVARSKRRHVLADCLGDTSHIGAQNTILGPARPKARQADDERLAAHGVPVGGIDGRPADADERLIVAKLWRVDFLQLEHVR
jgi:hypothetical protein